MEIVFKLSKIEFEFGELIQARLYGRTQKGERVCLVDTIYDYALIDVTDSKVDEIKSKIDSFKDDLKFEVFDAEVSDVPVKLLKVFADDSKTIRDVVEFSKNELKLNCYENDISFEKKYLLEKHIEYSKNYLVKFEEKEHDYNVDLYGNLDSMELLDDKSIDIPFKTLYFDIETYDDGGGIDYKKNPVLMISLYGKDFKKTLVAKTYDSKEDVEMFQSELEMLERLEDVIKEYNPDVISGYNIKGFDISYLIQRFKTYGIDFNIGSDFSNFVELKTKNKFALEGIVIFDIYQLVRHIMRFSLSTTSFSLDNVSKDLLGNQKEEVNLKRLSEIWSTDFDSKEMDLFVKYCMKDSVLCKELHDYFYFDLMEFMKMLNVSLEEISMASSSQIIEAYLVYHAREFNQVIPNRPDEDDVRSRRERHIQGAFVYDPIPGFYENIAIYDFTSLYPTIIESHNITKGTVSLEKVENSIKVPERNYYIKQDKKAFIPSVIGAIVTRRIRLKEMIKSEKDLSEKKVLKARLNTLKIIANSMYGYLVFYMSRWYSYEAGEAVTAFSRYNIKKVISTFEEKKYKVIYSDTDSVFVLLNDEKVSEAEEIVEKINSDLPGQMNLEFEDLFTRGIFVGQKGSTKGAKKKYALINSKGKYKIAGMALVRGDWSKVARDIQEEVIHILLEKKDSAKALKLVKEEVKNLSSREVKDFIVQTKLTKSPDEYSSKGPHVLVAEKMIAKGEFVRVGSFISYVICKGESKRIGDRAKLPEESSISDIDLDYYINNQILPVLEGVFDVFGIDVESEVNKKDSNLNSFF